jgi:Lrp/AsnC family transcriptional regulator
MDKIDQRILQCLQDDCTVSVTDVADRVGLSPSPCWRRIQKLAADGVIRRRVALLDADKMNVGVNVFVSIRTNRHDAEWARRFCREAAKIPEVVEFYRMSGQVDYLLRVVVPNVAAYDKVYKRLIETAELYDVSSSFAMETIKFTTALPTEYAP